MKINKSLFTLLLIVSITSLFISCSSDDDEDKNQNVKNITVKQAGTLPELITATEKNLITKLVVSGSINGTDIKYINDMNQLQYLDMKNSRIVAGGDAYSSYYGGFYTSDDEMGKYMFNSNMLKQIILPSSVKRIDNKTVYLNYDVAVGKVDLVIEGNSYYRTVNGVLYTNNGNKSELVIYAKYEGTEFVMPDFVSALPDLAFAYCDKLEKVKLSDNIESIGVGCFYKCKSLKKITFPKNLKVINTEAFKYCQAMETITIPESVEEIINGAFDGCSSLKEMHFKSKTPPFLYNGILFNTQLNMYVPKEAFDVYKNEYPWWSFNNEGRLFAE